MVVIHIFRELFDASSKVSVLSLPTVKEKSLKIEYSNLNVSKTVFSGREPVLPFAESEVFHAPISNCKQLVAENESCKAVYEVSFDVTGSNFAFKPGDTIGIIPHNIAREVDDIIHHLDLREHADVPYSLTIDTSQKGAKIPPHVPVKSTLRYTLTHCVDIRCALKKVFLLSISKYTENENEKRVLEYICSKEGTSMYTSHILEKNLCILDIFKIFQSCKPPIEVLLANLPRLLPRPYSVVNSRHKNPDMLKICFSVMDIGNNRKGLTTSWLEELILSGANIENGMKNLSITEKTVPIYVRKNISMFSMPDVSVPLILIGPGTGVAPYIGFLEEREAIHEKSPEKELGEVVLFFGCRNPEFDFIYEKEFKDFVTKGILHKLNTAFSRVENGHCKYVQNMIRQQGSSIVKLLNNGAAVFVCGDLKTMSLQVKEALISCIVEHDGKTNEEAERYIYDMQKDNRYYVDAWS